MGARREDEKVRKDRMEEMGWVCILARTKKEIRREEKREGRKEEKKEGRKEGR